VAIVRHGRPLLVAALAVIGLLLAASVSEAGSGSPRACGFVHASVPYSRHGHHDRWRVYVRGNASCASARGVLNAVMHLRATAHNGTSNADSYFTYRGWTCDFGQMGSQSCWRPKRRPYRASALALDCATAGGGCPARLPGSYLP
jgi:hypothetical protein